VIPVSAAIALALAAAGAAPSLENGRPIDQRISSSYDAAQALQGELDGSWDLRDLAGHQIYGFEIVNPPSRRHLEAAWRSPLPALGDQASGTAEINLATRSVLRLRFLRLGHLVEAELHRSRNGVWAGRLIEGGRPLRVVLRRPGQP
jgi:hypothetical protein